METLPSLLRRIRIRRGLSQEAVSAKARLSETYYGKIEVGKRRPGGEKLLQVLAALECSPEEEQAAITLFAQDLIPPTMLARLRRNPKLLVALALSGSLLGSPLPVADACPIMGGAQAGFCRLRKAAAAA